MIARTVADGAEESGDRTGVVARHFADDGVERAAPRDAEVAARDGRDQRHLVPWGKRCIGVRVTLVDGVEEAGRLLAERERGPDVRDPRAPSASSSSRVPVPARSRRPAKRRMRTCTRRA